MPDVAERRARILEAAFEVCERSGVDGARMDDVAALAHVSKGTLYRYFESKEDLLLATIMDSYERSLGYFPEEADPDPRLALESHLDAMVKVLAEVSPKMNVHYQARSLVAKNPGLGDRLHRFLREFHSERSAALIEIVQAGQLAGVLRADADATAFVEGSQAMLSGFLYRATFDPELANPSLLRRSFDAMVSEVLVVDGGQHG